MFWGRRHRTHRLLHLDKDSDVCPQDAPLTKQDSLNSMSSSQNSRVPLTMPRMPKQMLRGPKFPYRQQTEDVSSFQLAPDLEVGASSQSLASSNALNQHGVCQALQSRASHVFMLYIPIACFYTARSSPHLLACAVEKVIYSSFRYGYGCQSEIKQKG